MNKISLSTLGAVAWQELSQKPTGRLLGAGTRGAFFQLSTGRIIFLSREPYRGPLTLNLLQDPGLLLSIPTGSSLEVKDQSLWIPEAQLRISLHTAEIWMPAPVARKPLPKTERVDCLARWIDEAMKRQDPSGLLGQMSSLLVPTRPYPDAHLDDSIPSIHPVLRALDAPFDISSALAAIEPFLGLGSGLTPAGDDWIAGLLLGLSRWGQLFESIHFSSLAQPLVQAAYQKTTTLSANLIECAAAGLSDERLIDALDRIITGTSEFQHYLEGLLSWGHSSGGAALAGMGLAVLVSSE